jgi:hypothetical protein
VLIGLAGILVSTGRERDVDSFEVMRISVNELTHVTISRPNSLWPASVDIHLY